MATLHLVNKPTALQSCLDVVADDDSVLLIEDGVYGATGNVTRSLLVLAPDVEARGLKERMPDTAEPVGYDEFVALVETHKPIVTWC